MAAGSSIIGSAILVPIMKAGKEGQAGLDSTERVVPSVCLQCPGGCGIQVRTVNGRAVKIEGNPLYPSNAGTTCPKGQTGLQFLYDPDRIKGPLKRAGARGSDKWVNISWEEATGLVVSRLKEIRDRGLAHTVVFMSGRNRGHMGSLVDRFAEAYGTPNSVGHSSICEDGSPMGHWMGQGWKSYAAYDWANCDYLICFGGGFIEAWRPTAALLRNYGLMRRGRLGQRAKIVQVEPRFSITASKADEWLAINPGTDGALALGMANVIVREELFDKKFVEERTFGFLDWTAKDGTKHIGFRRLVLRDYPPEKVEEITGIPAEDIIRIAREFASKKPHAIAAGARGSSMQPHGALARHAIHALNALVGSLDVKGGILKQIDPPFSPYPAIVKDKLAQSSLEKERLDYAGTARYPLAGKVYQDIPERILQGNPYPVNALLCYYTNPFFSSPDISRWYQAIEKVPFLVTFSPFMDETSAHADIILPDDTYLERWQDDVIYPSVGFPVWGLRQPVVNRLYDTQNSGDVLIKIARGIGESMANSFPWNGFLELIQSRARGVYESRKGSIVANSFEEWWQKFTEAGVWTEPPYPYAAENPEQWKRVLATSSGKYEFYSQELRKKLVSLAEKEAKHNHTTPEAEMDNLLANLKLRARGDEVYLPHYEEPRFVGDERNYPFILNSYKLMTHAEGRGANVPALQKRLGLQLFEKWDSWVEINPGKAKELGIKDGDWVFVESTVGKVRVRARLHPGALPNVVNMPFEHGHKFYGRWSSTVGANPNDIIAKENDQLGGNAAWFSTRVRIYLA